MYFCVALAQSASPTNARTSATHKRREDFTIRASSVTTSPGRTLLRNFALSMPVSNQISH